MFCVYCILIYCNIFKGSIQEKGFQIPCINGFTPTELQPDFSMHIFSQDHFFKNCELKQSVRGREQIHQLNHNDKEQVQNYCSIHWGNIQIQLPQNKLEYITIFSVRQFSLKQLFIITKQSVKVQNCRGLQKFSI